MQEKEYSPLTNEEIQHAFQHGTASEISQTLVTLALYASDWKPVEQYCLDFLESADAGVRKVAATCLGHLARLHQQLDLDRVLAALYKHLSDPDKYVAGAANDALDDIEIFMHVPVQRLESNHDKADDVVLEEDDEEEPRPLTNAEVEQVIQSGNMLEIEKLLVALTYHDPDWQRAETYSLQFLDYSDASVRAVAVDCLYRLAATGKTLHFDQVIPALNRHRSDESKLVRSKVEGALRYIQTYLHIPVEPTASSADAGFVPAPSTAQANEKEAPPKKWDRRALYDTARLTFVIDPLAHVCEDNEVCVTVPVALSSAQELIDLLTTTLDLPPPAEHNWSALSNILSSWDEWRTTPQRLVLLHSDLPFMQSNENGAKQLRLYLTALIRSIVKVQEKNATRLPSEGSRALVAIFPTRAENDLRVLMAAN